MVVKEVSSRTEKIPHASHFGLFHTHARDGKIVDITPQLDSDTNPTVMLKGVSDSVTTDSRVKYPCVRKSYLEGKDAVDLKGKEEFVRVSWDKNLDLAANAIKKAQAKGGNKSLYNSYYSGWSHPGAFKPNALVGRFFNQIGVLVLLVNIQMEQLVLQSCNCRRYGSLFYSNCT